MTMVPVGWACWMEKSAPMTAARFRMMRRPRPSPASPPMPRPSSRISRTTALSFAKSRIATTFGSACLSALVQASWAM